MFPALPCTHIEGRIPPPCPFGVRAVAGVGMEHGTEPQLVQGRRAVVAPTAERMPGGHRSMCPWIWVEQGRMGLGLCQAALMAAGTGRGLQGGV